MKRTMASLLMGLFLVLLAGGMFQRDVGAQEKKNLVTSGVKLKPILIGKSADSPGKALSDEGTKFDGSLNIVTDTPYQIWGEMGTYIHVAIYDPEFKPAKEAVVYMDGKAFGKADATGTFVFSEAPNPDMSYGNSHTLDVVYAKGGKKYRGQTYFNAYPRTQGFESASIFVYTDRGMYNPGQTIHIRAIGWALRDDFYPMVGKQIELLLKNDRGQVVAGGGVETDKWGIAWMDIPLPENAPEGKYKLEASCDRESATADLRIERFTPPVIEIKHTLGRFLIKDTPELPFEVTLGYFGGGAFKAGAIKISVKAGGKIAHEESREVKGGGPHKFVLGKEALKKIQQNIYENDTVTVKITATDPYGRRDELKRDMRYTSNPYNVIVEMDKDQYTTGETAHIMIRAADVEQVPARDKEIRLELEGKSYKSKTDKSGLAKFDIAVPNKYLSGNVYIEGVQNVVAYAYINWMEPRPMSSEIPAGYVKEKEETKIVINFPTDFVPKEEVVHVDIVDSSGALIGAALVPVKKEGGRYAARGTFPAPAWGSMLLTIFCVGTKGKEPIGLLTDGQNLPVLPDREITIDFEGVAKEVKPGDKIKIKAVLKDAAGKKLAGAVGASIVDEAVLSLLDPLEKTPMDKFYNPEFKVLSTTGSKILTWPVVARNWGSPQYDIALPPFGFRAGGATNPYPGGGGGYGGGYGYGGGGYGGGGDYSYDSVMEEAPAPPPKQAPKKDKVYKKEAKEKAKKGGMAPSMPMPSAPSVASKSAYAAPMEALAADEEAGLYRAATGGAAQPSNLPVSITIRTNFAETSLWAPDVEVKDGKLEFFATLPDSITTQTITLMASDDKGGVGMARRKVDVLQEVYVRGSLPATLTVGDSVEVYAMVRNMTKKAVSCKVSLASEAFEVAGSSVKEVQVPAEGAGAASFVIKPVKAGKGLYEVKAEGSGFTDLERREIFIRPVGLPDRVEAKGVLKKGKPFKASVKVSGKDQYLEAFVHVSLPTAVPVIQGMERILGEPGGAIDFVSSKALTTAMVYQYLLAAGKNEDAIVQIKPFLQQLMAGLLMTQNADGGWGWHFMIRGVSVEGKEDIIPVRSNPYMTAQSLEGLVEMKRAGLPVPESAVAMALQSLSGTMNSDVLWSVDDIAFWEGKTKQVQEGVSAEIFRVMADACEVYPNQVYSNQATMAKLYESFKSYLGNEEVRDPMALASAATGVYTWAKVNGQVSSELEKQLKAAAKKLILLRKEAYWEPSWFNAFGGTLEATAAAMMFMSKLDREGFEAELRRSVQYILSTQESLGAWHNARGTAAAIRGLLLIPPTEKEIASEVKVKVNGQVIERVAINPDDPYLSAIGLSQVEITRHLIKGDNSVELTYDGNLKAPVTLHLEKWSAKKAFSAVAQQGAPAVEVSRSYSGDAKQEGAPVEVKLALNVKEARGPLLVREPLPSNAEVEGASLDALMDAGAISGYEDENDSIVFYLAPDKAGKVELSYRLGTVRRGTAIQPGTMVSSVADPDAYVSAQPTTFNVL